MRWEAGRTECYVTCSKETPDCFIRLPPGGDPITASYCSCWCNLPFPKDFCLSAFLPSNLTTQRNPLIHSKNSKRKHSLQEDVCFQNASLLLLLNNFLHCLAAEDCSSITSICAVWAETRPLQFLWQALGESVLCCRASWVSSAAFSDELYQAQLEG